MKMGPQKRSKIICATIATILVLVVTTACVVWKPGTIGKEEDEIDSLFERKRALELVNREEVVDGRSGVNRGGGTVFRVCSKTPEKKAFTSVSRPEAIVQNLPICRRDNCRDILQVSSFSNASYSTSNGFVSAVVDAYRGHHNLILRPDDVWAAIMVQFSFHVNKNAEKFRKQFVDFEGKRGLVVHIPGSSLRSASYDTFVTRMSKKIDENLIDPQVKGWILPSFSTTTRNDIVSIGVVFMASLKHYFSYTGKIMCGIPSITLEGTLEDWQDIYERLEKLKEYDLTDWYKMLKPILKQFVSVKQQEREKRTKPDTSFWEKICNIQTENGGCALDTFITGWITAFAVFDSDGRMSSTFGVSQWPRIDVSDVPPGMVQVPVKIIDVDDTAYNATMYAGHMAVEVRQNGYTLTPSLGWAIALETESS